MAAIGEAYFSQTPITASVCQISGVVNQSGNMGKKYLNVMTTVAKHTRPDVNVMLALPPEFPLVSLQDSGHHGGNR